MTAPDRAGVRRLLLDALDGGAPVARAALLHFVARHAGVDPAQRRLRALVSTELRALEAEGRLVDGGPEVWLVPGRAE